MYFIKSFPSSISNLSNVYSWLSSLEINNRIVSNLHLKLILNEGFVNACNASNHEDAPVIIIVKELKGEQLEVIITDSGPGFKIGSQHGNFSEEEIGTTYKLFAHPLEELITTVISKNIVRFSVQHKRSEVKELLEKHRGILFMLKVATTVEYHYSQKGFNYLYVKING